MFQGFVSLFRVRMFHLVILLGTLFCLCVASFILCFFVALVVRYGTKSQSSPQGNVQVDSRWH